jgi:superfamily II DNA helicase RecQ
MKRIALLPGGWGSEFRTAYSELAKLHAFFLPHIPILATSATLTPPVLQGVCASLMIDLDDNFFLNLLPW